MHNLLGRLSGLESSSLPGGKPECLTWQARENHQASQSSCRVQMPQAASGLLVSIVTQSLCLLLICSPVGCSDRQLPEPTLGQ